MSFLLGVCFFGITYVCVAILVLCACCLYRINVYINYIYYIYQVLLYLAYPSVPDHSQELQKFKLFILSV